MNIRMNERIWLILVLGFIAAGLWLAGAFVPVGLAAPFQDANVPTATLTPIPTNTPLPLPTAEPPPTDTPTTVSNQVAATEPPAEPTQPESNVAERTGEEGVSRDAGSSVLSFLLCAGVIIVVGLAGLNIWARRNP